MMVKVTGTKGDKAKKKIMTEVDRRRAASGIVPNNLRRSKSVRASLRMIGTRLLSHKHEEERPMKSAGMQKSPSLSNIREKNENFFNQHVSSNPSFYADAGGIGVETILKTPMGDPGGRKPPPGYLGLRKVEFLARKERAEAQRLMLSQPPSVVAPKAAALLHIPIKENCEPVFYRPKSTAAADLGHHRSWFPQYVTPRDDAECQGRAGGDSAFQRTSLRLSITSSKRKHNAALWSSAFSSTSST